MWSSLPTRVAALAGISALMATQVNAIMARGNGTISHPHGNGTTSQPPDGNEPDGTDNPPLPDGAPPYVECTSNYKTLEELDADESANKIPASCRAYYLVSALGNVLNDAVFNYNWLIDNGYDSKFDTYSHAVADGASKTVWDFINGHGNQYFTCTVSETTVCCDKCKNGAAPAEQCRYCFNDKCYEYCNGVSGCKRDTIPLLEGDAAFEAMQKRDSGGASQGSGGPSQVEVVQTSNQTEPCPPDYSMRGYDPEGKHPQSVYWSLSSDKSAQFYADLLQYTGVPQDKTSLGDYNRGNNCPPSASKGDGNDCWSLGYDYGMVIPSYYSASDVANPKTVVQTALNNSNSLNGQIADLQFTLKMDAYDGDPMELIDTISMPVLMVSEAIESMKQVQDTAEEIEEEQRKALILAFVGAILFLIPIAGEVLGSVAELADIAAIVTVLGAAGNAAFDVYNIVDDPQNAPLAILSLILEPLALTDLVKISKAANIRRGMSAEDLAKLGSRVSTRMVTVKKITGTCCKTA